MDKTLNLSLRQKKLLHIMQGTEGFITGNELARQLGVSPRTIRSDVAEINRTLAPHRAQILSERSKGYLYSAEDPDAIENMNRIDYAFFTKDDRVRYLAFRLCLSDEPLDIYDLEDEMYVSRTTLEHDLHQLRMKYVLSGPQIRFIQNRELLSFEADEKKRRSVLNQLFHEDWNYNARNNAYYGYHFLDRDVLEYIMDEIPIHLRRYHISMEDPSLVSLNLAVAIMYHRVRSGHPLPAADPVPRSSLPVSQAVDDLFCALEAQFACSYAVQERDDIYRRIASACLPDITAADPSAAGSHFSALTIRFADAYLERVRDVFGIDFSRDRDFYLTLLFYLQYLQVPDRIFNEQGNYDIAKENLLTEFEIACLIEDLALEYLGCYITETELLYLAYCISGALEFLFDTHPELKLKAVICCHQNMPAGWALKRKVLGAFDKYIDVTALLPVNLKNACDFRDTDLVLTTVRKQITVHPGTDTIQLSPFLSPRDYLTLSAYIHGRRVQMLCRTARLPLGQLLKDAYWHEKGTPGDKFSVIESMAADFVSEGIVPAEYITGLLRRESISTFVITPGIVFMHSLVPAARTQLSITTFDHRVIWNSRKIRIVVLATFRPEEAALLLLLNHAFCNEALDIDTLKMLKTKKEIIRFFTGEGDGEE